MPLMERFFSPDRFREDPSAEARRAGQSQYLDPVYVGRIYASARAKRPSMAEWWTPEDNAELMMNLADFIAGRR
jgi:hypothetical protein